MDLALAVRLGECNRSSLIRAAKARRLRHLPVDKGLLREDKQVQNILDSLIMCKVGSSFSPSPHP